MYPFHDQRLGDQLVYTQHRDHRGPKPVLATYATLSTFIRTLKTRNQHTKGNKNLILSAYLDIYSILAYWYPSRLIFDKSERFRNKGPLDWPDMRRCVYMLYVPPHC